MSLVFLPSESRLIFVGREEQIESFSSIVNGERPEWILHIPGDGGIGKTRLLEQFEKNSQSEFGDALASTGIIDFYDTNNQTKIGLLNEIAQRLKFDPHGEFQTEFQEVSESTGLDQVEQFEQAYEKFLVEYKDLLNKQDKVIILFDTCEEMHGVEEWLLDHFLNDIGHLEEEISKTIDGYKRKTVVILAGRKRLNLARYGEAVWERALPLLGLTEIRQ